MVNGDDRWFDERYHYSYNGGFNWTSKNAATSLASYVLVGPGQLPTFPPLNTPLLPLGVPQSPPRLPASRITSTPTTREPTLTSP